MTIDPGYYLTPVYISFYSAHPEVKDIEIWNNVPIEYLDDDPHYKAALIQQVKAESYILTYLERPEKAWEYYFEYGKLLEGRGYTWQYFIWYNQIYLKERENEKDNRPELLSALLKLAPFTTQVIKQALGEYPST